MRALFREYTDGLGIDLAFQDVATELALIPGKYAEPAGAVLLVRDAGRAPVGCVALRPGERAGECEMKRLYVRSAARGLDLGRRLVLRLIEYARARGYERMLLDTLDSMHAAQRLYASLGFRAVAAYYDNPLPGTVYMAVDLTCR